MSSSSESSTDQSSSAHESMHEASDAAAMLLEQMNERGATAGTQPTQLTASTATRAPPQQWSREKALRGESCTTEELEEVRKTIIVQDQIIASIQADNEAMRVAAKQMQAHAKEVESKFAHLEAKHSLMLSARESSSSSHPAEVSKLVAKNKELQRSLEVAEANALSAVAETRKLLEELERASGLEEQISSMKMEANQRELEHRAEVDELRRQLDTLRSAEENRRVSSAANVSVTSIDHVEIEHGRTERVPILQQRIKELERALQEQNNRNMSELIQSVGATQQAQSMSRLTARIQQLEEALTEKDACMERMVERLRTESNGIRSTYEATIAKLEAQLRQAQTARSTEMTAKLQQKMEATGDAYREAQIAAADQLRVQLDILRKEHEKLAERFTAREAELENYKMLAEESRILLQRCNETMEHQSAAFKDDFLRHLRDVRHKHNEDIDRLQRNHREEMAHALEELSEVRQHLISWQPPEIRTCGNDREEEKGRTFLQSVLGRLEYLERHCLRREKERAFEITEAKRVARSEVLRQRQHYEMLLSQKNQQLNQFRMELDGMMASISGLKHTTRF